MKWTTIVFLCLPAYGQTWFSNVTKAPASNSCTVHWTTAVPTIGHIQYGTAAGVYTKSTSNTATYSSHTTATMSSLTAKTTYHLRLVSSDSTKDWVTSLDSTCTTTAPPTTAQHSVKLNWLASSSSSVSAYEIYRSTVSGGYYMLLTTIAGLTYTDNTVQPGSVYYYAIRAKNVSGRQSSYSNQAKATIP
jgi:fibronectin type 3 domain-containing protein